MRVFAYIMWEWLCRFFVWACSLVNVFVSMSMCEWMHDHVCMWKVVFGNVSELMSTWLYVWVSMLIVCICEYICACDFVHMQVKSVISDDASTLTLITLMSVCVSLCMHVDVLEKTFEHVQVSIVECVFVTVFMCEWMCNYVDVQVNPWAYSSVLVRHYTPMSECVSMFMCECVCELVKIWTCLYVSMCECECLHVCECQTMCEYVSMCEWMSDFECFHVNEYICEGVCVY